MRHSAIGDPGVCHRQTTYGSRIVDRKASSSQTRHGRFQGPLHSEKLSLQVDSQPKFNFENVYTDLSQPFPSRPPLI
jgi:hypothetical protein